MQPKRALTEWIQQEVVFFSWGKHWKGVYVHCIPGNWCYRFFLWGWDRHKRSVQSRLRLPY